MTRRQALFVCSAALVLSVLLYLMPLSAPISHEFYLPLHIFLETFAVCVAVLIFAVGWHFYTRLPSPATLLLACGFLGVGLLDFGHILAFQGMPHWVTPSGPEKGINFWLAARLAAALTLLAAVLAPWQAESSKWFRHGLLLATLLLVASIYLVLLYAPEVVPRTFHEDTGLTRFKVLTEYLIVLLHIVTAALIWRWRTLLQGVDAFALFTAVVLMAVGELPFTWYASMSDLNHLAGHLIKVVAYLYLYRALVHSRIQAPYLELTHARDRLQATLEALPDLMMEIDDRMVVRDCRAGRDALALPVDAILGRSLDDLLPEEPLLAWQRARAEVDASGHSMGQQYRLDTAQGRRWFEISATRLSEPGQPDAARYLVLLRDVTERKEQEAELRIAATAFQSQEGMLVADRSMRSLRINQAFEETVGLSHEQVAGRDPLELFFDSGEPGYRQRIFAALEANGKWQGELWCNDASGDLLPVRVSITAVGDELGEPMYYVFDLIDLRELQEAQATIERLVRYDALTGLPNRQQLLERLEDLAGTPAGRVRHHGLLHIDLDDFKQVNETAGFQAGDRVLGEAARRLSALEEEGALVCRHSADEFFVLAGPLAASEREAVRAVHELAVEIEQWLKQPYQLGEAEIVLGASIGCVVFAGAEVPAQELIRRVDFALNQAKADAHTSVAFYDQNMQQFVNARVSMVQELRAAVAAGALQIVYQAQVDGNSRLVGAEALLRWESRSHGPVSPAEFIPLAEQHGLMPELDEFVLAGALAQLAHWQQQPGTRSLCMGVNISSGEFHRPGFAERVVSLLDEHELLPGTLMLELTERTLIENFEHVRVMVKALQARGVRFAIDDFGTGYSSLSYLSRLPIDQLKIDQSFLAELDTSASDAALVRMIIELSRTLGVEVIAGGVETEAQREFLQRHGCQLYQGFLFARPLPATEFERQLLAGIWRSA